MPKHHDATVNVAKRQQAVAQLKLRHGWSAPRITEELAKHADLLNPQTQRPWSLPTVKRDLQSLESHWRQEATRDMATLKAAHLAAVREARSAAWTLTDLGSVLRALQQEGALLGLEAPKKVTTTDLHGTAPASVHVVHEHVYDDTFINTVCALLAEYGGVSAAPSATNGHSAAAE